MGKRPDLVYVATLTKRLIQAKAEVKRLSAEWEALFPTDGVQNDISTSASKPETNVSRILSFLNSRAGEAFNAKQVATELDITNEQSVASTLSKLVKQRRINKHGSDSYTTFESKIDLEAQGIPNAVNSLEDFR